MGSVSRVCFLIGIDAFSLQLPSIVFPMFLRSRFLLDESELGHYLGRFESLLAGSIIFSSLFYGHLSDKFSHFRPLFLSISFLLNAFFMITLAYSTSLLRILSTRLLCYAMSSVWVVCASYLTDFGNKNSKLKSTAFGYAAASYSLGRGIGSLTGGFLLSLGSLGNFGVKFLFLDEFSVPFLLTFVLQLIGVLASYTISTKSQEDSPRPLRSPESIASPLSRCSSFINLNENLDLNFDDFSPEIAVLPAPKSNLFRNIKMVFFSKSCRLSVLTYMTNQCGNSCTLVVIILFLSTLINYGGLGFTSLQVGLFFFSFGLLCVLFQFCVFCKIVEQFPLKIIFRIGALFIAIALSLLTFTAKFHPVFKILVLIFCIFSIAIGWITGSVAFTLAVATFPSNSSGSSTGLLNSCAALSKMIGATVSGSLFALLLRNGLTRFSGVIPCFFYLFSIILSFFTNKV
ncbi:hypothetical protein RCL1_005219 [Eukaryota sp. TZLM3-RCL]